MNRIQQKAKWYILAQESALHFQVTISNFKIGKQFRKVIFSIQPSLCILANADLFCIFLPSFLFDGKKIDFRRFVLNLKKKNSEIYRDAQNSVQVKVKLRNR